MQNDIKLADIALYSNTINANDLKLAQEKINQEIEKVKTALNAAKKDWQIGFKKACKGYALELLKKDGINVEQITYENREKAYNSDSFLHSEFLTYDKKIEALENQLRSKTGNANNLMQANKNSDRLMRELQKENT